MNDILKKYKLLFAEERPEKWDLIPDIELYMDQVISYMQRQHLGFDVNESLTSSMVNNYAKQEVMPRANGKKYTREHIAYLTAICLLKQILSVSDTKVLLDEELKDEEISSFYEKYTDILDQNLIIIDNLIDADLDKGKRAELALKLAISSYTQKLACQCLVDSLKDDITLSAKEKNKEKSEKD